MTRTEPQPTWVTADGRRLVPEQMSKSHLINTLKMILRRSHRRGFKKRFHIAVRREMRRGERA